MIGFWFKHRLAACVFCFSLGSVEAWGKTHEILILEQDGGQSNIFKPFFTKMAEGDTFVFKPQMDGHQARFVLTPQKAAKLAGNITNNEEIKLQEPGVYIYECIFHNKLGMAGVIQVGEATNREEALTFYAEFKKKFIIYQDRLDGIMNALR